jgi:hypothetical protein
MKNRKFLCGVAIITAAVLVVLAGCGGDYILIVNIVDDNANDVSETAVIQEAMRKGGQISVNTDALLSIDSNFYSKYTVDNGDGMFLVLPAILNFFGGNGWHFQQSGFNGYFVFVKARRWFGGNLGNSIYPSPETAARTKKASGENRPASGEIIVVNGRRLEVAPASTEFRANWYDAKSRCASLRVNGIGGWRLPDKDELNAMYMQLKKNGLGGFSDYGYWSSSEVTNDVAWYQWFIDGYQNNTYGKSTALSVRAVRAF